MKKLTGHPNEFHIRWHFTLSEMPTHSNYQYQIKIEDPIDGLIQELDIRNGVKLGPEDFELGGFWSGGPYCVRVRGGVREGKILYKTWLLDMETNKFVSSPECLLGLGWLVDYLIGKRFTGKELGVLLPSSQFLVRERFA